jgi:hypothetical protein
MESNKIKRIGLPLDPRKPRFSGYSPGNFLGAADFDEIGLRSINSMQICDYGIVWEIYPPLRLFRNESVRVLYILHRRYLWAPAPYTLQLSQVLKHFFTIG